MQFLLVVEEVYLLHRLAFLRELQLKCYNHIDYIFQHSGVVAVFNIHLCLYGSDGGLIPRVLQCHDFVFLFLRELIIPFLSSNIIQVYVNIVWD